MTNTADLINGIPAKRWRVIALRVDATEEEILNSASLMMAVAANEKHRIETGKDDYVRFLDMGLGALGEYLRDDEDEEGEADEADPKSDPEAPAAGGGVGEEPSPVLPGYEG